MLYKIIEVNMLIKLFNGKILAVVLSCTIFLSGVIYYVCEANSMFAPDSIVNLSKLEFLPRIRVGIN